MRDVDTICVASERLSYDSSGALKNYSMQKNEQKRMEVSPLLSKWRLLSECTLKPPNSNGKHQILNLKAPIVFIDLNRHGQESVSHAFFFVSKGDLLQHHNT